MNFEINVQQGTLMTLFILNFLNYFLLIMVK